MRRNILKRSMLFKAMNLFLVFTFSFYNIGFAAIDNMSNKTIIGQTAEENLSPVLRFAYSVNLLIDAERRGTLEDLSAEVGKGGDQAATILDRSRTIFDEAVGELTSRWLQQLKEKMTTEFGDEQGAAEWNKFVNDDALWSMLLSVYLGKYKDARVTLHQLVLERIAGKFAEFREGEKGTKSPGSEHATYGEKAPLTDHARNIVDDTIHETIRHMKRALLEELGEDDIESEKVEAEFLARYSINEPSTGGSFVVLPERLYKVYIQKRFEAYLDLQRQDPEGKDISEYETEIREALSVVTHPGTRRTRQTVFEKGGRYSDVTRNYYIIDGIFNNLTPEEKEVFAKHEELHIKIALGIIPQPEGVEEDWVNDQPGSDVRPILARINPAYASHGDFLPASAPEESQPIYFFGLDQEGRNLTEGDASLKELLGGKGAYLAQMTKLTYVLDGVERPIPVPPGFTITTEEAKKYLDTEDREIRQYLADHIDAYIAKLEAATGRVFGGKENPLLLSIRSGASVSMPGMMDTVLNLGLNDEIVLILEKELVDGVKGGGEAAEEGRMQAERSAWDSYRRLLMMFGEVVMGIKKEKVEGKEQSLFAVIFDSKKKEKGYIQDTQLTADDLKDIVKQFKSLIKEKTGRDFPQDVKQQLTMAIKAVFDSSNSERAIAYKRMKKIPMHIVSAVNVQSMVFGNLNDNSATSVAFTRDLSTGENRFNGEWLRNAQGEDVVSGVRTPMPLNEGDKQEFLELHPEYNGREAEVQTLQEAMPERYREIDAIQDVLERVNVEAQDIEFTIQDGVTWFLQTRRGQRTAVAALNILMDQFEAGEISREEAVMRLRPEQIDEFLHPIFNVEDKKKAKAANRIMTKGLNASPGASVGIVVFSSDEAVAIKEADKGKKPEERRKTIMVTEETSPEDIKGMEAAAGILTVKGGKTSHAAVVARGMGKTAIVGAGKIRINVEEGYFEVNGVRVKRGEVISIDGYTGEVITGEVKTDDSIILKGKKGEELNEEEQKLFDRFNRFFDWVDEYRGKDTVRANAETPVAVSEAIEFFGADGIGLARTEHMFFEDSVEGQNRLLKFRKMILTGEQQYLDELLEYQTEDFKSILEILEGRPLTVRLLDPPLHEFLPNPDKEEDRKVIALLAEELGKPEAEIISIIESLKQDNPMFGHRGDRLLMVNPEIAEMQARAIFNAIQAVEGTTPRQMEIEIPLIGLVAEFDVFAEMIEKIGTEEYGFTRGKEYILGTMIETPSAAMTADEIARKVDFFSFGTNDLTQSTLKFSRDDAGTIVIPKYLEEGILEVDPFVSMGREVAELVRIATALGKWANPAVECGLCGEQGGDPLSLSETILPAGLDYTSVSPYRVLVAKLSTAQKKIGDKSAGRETKEQYDLSKLDTWALDIKPINVYKADNIFLDGQFGHETTVPLIVAAALGRDDQYIRDALKRFTDKITDHYKDLFFREHDRAVRLFNEDFGFLPRTLSQMPIAKIASLLGPEVSEEDVKSAIEKLEEANPALGNKGVRQALTGYEFIFKAQIHAIARAMKNETDLLDLPTPSIIVPLLIDHQELKKIVDMVDQIFEEEGVDRSRLSIGASIETPRAVLQADRIAKIADFIVFDTISLTESVLATTRKDAESFLPTFIEKGIYPEDPFKVVPQNVRKFIGIAVRRAREGDPDIPFFYYGGEDKMKQRIQPLLHISGTKKTRTPGIAAAREDLPSGLQGSEVSFIFESAIDGPMLKEHVRVIGNIDPPAIIGDRVHTLTIQDGAITLEVNGTPLVDAEGTTIIFARDTVLTVRQEGVQVTGGEEYKFQSPLNSTSEYKLVRQSIEPAEVEIDYIKTPAERAVYSVSKLVQQYLPQIREKKIDLILPKEMFTGQGTSEGSKVWEQNMLDGYFGKGVVKIITYNASAGLDQKGLINAVANSVRAGNVPVLAATGTDLENAEGEELQVALGDVRVLALPDIKTLGKKAWSFMREVEGTAILQALLTSDSIDNKTSIAEDMQRLMAQLTTNRVNINDLYFMLPFNDKGIPSWIKSDDPFSWMIALVKRLLLNMEIKPLDPTLELNQRRKILWAA